MLMASSQQKNLGHYLYAAGNANKSFSTLSHEKTPANGEVEPGPRKPLYRVTTGLR